MESKDIDRPAFASHVERDLDCHFPAVLTQQLRYNLDEGCMGGVEQTVESLPSPPQANVDVSAQCSGDLVEDADRHRSSIALFDAGHLGSGYPGCCCEINLPELALDPQDTD
jgi:hypothetical protein